MVPINEEPFTEIAGTWPEVQILLNELVKTKSDESVVAAAIKRATNTYKYVDDSLLTVDQLFGVIDLIYEIASERKNYSMAAIVSSNLGSGFRKALKTGDLANNRNLLLNDDRVRAEMILENVYDQIPTGLTTIIFDIVGDAWYKSGPESVDQLVYMTVDEILEARGLLKSPSGSGRRGGYRKAQRDEVERHLRLLHSIMISVRDYPIWIVKDGKRVQDYITCMTPAIIFEAAAKKEPFRGYALRPGRIFAENYISGDQQYARLNQRAWHYDHLRQAWEISLAYYFSRLWRIRAYRRDQLYQGTTVKKILEEINQGVDTRNPKRTRKRLEDALDQLCFDDILYNWRYDTLRHVTGYGWTEKWLQCKVYVTPPRELLEHYPVKLLGSAKPAQGGKKGGKQGHEPSQNGEKGSD